MVPENIHTPTWMVFHLPPTPLWIFETPPPPTPPEISNFLFSPKSTASANLLGKKRYEQVAHTVLCKKNANKFRRISAIVQPKIP